MYFDINDKVRLFYRVWSPEKEIKAVILLIHGYAEHSGRYEKAGQSLSGSGFKVYAPDLPGHGQSTGKRGLAQDIVTVTEYIKNFTDFIRKENNNSKIFLIGHSMGGGLSLLFASSFGSSISGLITSGAAVHPQPYPPYPVRLFLKYLAGLFPTIKIRKLGSRKISTLEEVVNDYKSDPLNYNGRVMAGTAVELFRIRKLVEKSVQKIIEPVFLLHGKNDRLALSSGSRFVYENVLSEDKKIKLYDDCRHEILNDKKQDEVLKDITAWLLKRC